MYCENQIKRVLFMVHYYVPTLYSETALVRIRTEDLIKLI
jgi:hypothetical protein